MPNHEDLDALRAALVGRSVKAVRLVPDGTEKVDDWGPTVQGEVVLDDGRVLKLAGNGPDCACNAGEYDLTQLNDMPINGITDVQVEVDDSTTDRDGEGLQVYRLFVLAQDDRIELATFEGDDGNGYYGTGFWFTIAS
jgi:hypothetical protein